jgi:hypothetical protein
MNELDAEDLSFMALACWPLGIVSVILAFWNHDLCGQATFNISLKWPYPLTRFSVQQWSLPEVLEIDLSQTSWPSNWVQTAQCS